MGWTGIFNWDSSESNKEILDRQFFNSSEHKFEPVKWSSKGSHVWLLYRHKESGFHYAAVILCQRDRKNHEFLYKELGLDSGPCLNDMPKSWLGLIEPSYPDGYGKEWLMRYKEQSNKPKEPAWKIGDVIECSSKHSITWSTGYKIEPEERFYIKIIPHQTRSRVVKLFSVYKDLDRIDYPSCYRVNHNTFKNLTKQLIKGGTK